MTEIYRGADAPVTEALYAEIASQAKTAIGELILESQIGVGTKAVIKIPKEVKK